MTKPGFGGPDAGLTNRPTGGGDIPPALTESLSYKQARRLFLDGVMGTKEFRNWLARNFPDFEAVRDGDVDKSIEALAESRAEFLKQQEQNAMAWSNSSGG